MAASTSQQADSLALKKKARRRLVGTITLVLVSLLILPNIFEDKTHRQPESYPVVVTAYETQQPQRNQPQTVRQHQAAPAKRVENNAVNDLPKVAQKAPELALESHESAVSVAQAPKLKAHESAQVKPFTPKGFVGEAAEVKQAPVVAPKKQQLVPKPVVKDKVVAVKAKKAALSDAEKAKLLKSMEKDLPPLPTKQAVIAQKPKANVSSKQAVAVEAKFSVQLGVFADPENVKKMQAKIALAGYQSKISRFKQNERLLTRLQVGNFVKRDSAERALRRLEKRGFRDGVIVSR